MSRPFEAFHMFAPLALIAAIPALAACSAEPTATPLPTATSIPASEPTAAAPSTDSPASAGGWREDVIVGSAVGDRAPDVALMLPDGRSATLQELAAGKPVLLYFFATW